MESKALVGARSINIRFRLNKWRAITNKECSPLIKKVNTEQLVTDAPHLPETQTITKHSSSDIEHTKFIIGEDLI